MSHKVTTLVASRTIGGSAMKAVLMNMADKASDGGEGVFASKNTIASDTELSLPTVKRAFKDLMDAGLIAEVGTRGCTNGHTVVYDLNIKAIAALPAWKKEGQTGVTVNPVHGEPGSSRTPTRFMVTPHPVHHEPQTILEPSLNQEANASLDHTREANAEQVTRKPPKRASALPENWVPSDRNLADARSRNFTDEEIHEQAAAFRDHHLARGTTFKDWDAGWRTWLGNARRFARPAAARNARTRSAHDVMLAGFQSAALRD